MDKYKYVTNVNLCRLMAILLHDMNNIICSEFKVSFD